MAGSRLVQSPFISVTPLLRKTSFTAESVKALRSLTRQVRHQLAVKFTSSGRPAALSLASCAASYGCHPSAACAPCAETLDAAAATSAKRTGRRMASSTASVAVASATTRPAAALDLD